MRSSFTRTTYHFGHVSRVASRCKHFQSSSQGNSKQQPGQRAQCHRNAQSGKIPELNFNSQLAGLLDYNVLETLPMTMRLPPKLLANAKM